MKKLLILVLVSLFSAIPGARSENTRADYVTRFESCEAILRQFMGDRAYAIPPEVLQRAHGLVIVNQFKAGFILGVTGGYGVILVKKPDGRWSIPVLLNAGAASLGLQIGGKAIETVYVLTNDEEPRKLFNGRYNVGVDAKAVMGPRWAEAESVNQEILDSPVLVYVKTKGLFAGATVKAGFIARDDDANREYYKTPYTLPELLYSDFVKPTPEVQPLMDYVKSIAP